MHGLHTLARPPKHVHTTTYTAQYRAIVNNIDLKILLTRDLARKLE
jgi:hypothetical protein